MATPRAKDAAVVLYRSIIRAHKRYLPKEMKGLGDSYVKSEFNLFKKVKDEEQLNQFYTEWNDYLSRLKQTARAKEAVSAGSLEETSNNVAFGKSLSADVELSDEQIIQLQKLKEETNKAGLPGQD